MPTTVSQTKRVFVSDCEGPISINDNAFELAKSFMDKGDQFFSLISKYDDVLVDIIKKPDYEAGDTLRLILPFLKAYGATDKNIKKFSSKKILLVPGAKDMLAFIRGLMPSFIVSTSYEHYITALCKLTNFPFENTYCTRLKMDKYQIPEEETQRLKELAKEIATLPMIDIPKNANTINEFSSIDQKTVRRLDEIFWEEFCNMESGRMLLEVNPVGGKEKAKAVQNIVEMLGCNLDQVMYVGDSITDVQALKLVKKNGGLAVSFNGNGYSIKESNVAFLSKDATVISVLAEVFNKKGKRRATGLVRCWDIVGLEKYCVSEELRNRMSSLFGRIFPKFEIVKPDSIEQLICESSVFRKTVRGEDIGKLG
jgi:energy-converting hydrogenase A subunit R